VNQICPRCQLERARALAVQAMLALDGQGRPLAADLRLTPQEVAETRAVIAAARAAVLAAGPPTFGALASTRPWPREGAAVLSGPIVGRQ